jgi:serine/threonine protein kinase
MDASRPGRRFGVGDVVAKKYRVLHELGAGGAAHVFLAVARGPIGFHKLVVLKVPKPELAGDPDFQRLFTKEARLAARLNHPNIVQTFEVVTARGLPVIVMEYLEGQPLSAILSAVRDESPPTGTRNREFPLAMHLRVLVDALAGLSHAHDLADYDGAVLGVVHRDMSPHNIFVTFQGEVKVLDFGVAKLAEVEAETRTVRGKLRYMPPEQLACRRVDRRADVFAVGVLLWEAMVGQRLWQGRFNEEIRRRVLSGDIPPPSQVRSDVPPELEAICLKALSHDPDRRYPTAADLGREIERYFGTLGTPVTSRQLGRTVSLLFQSSLRQQRMELDSQLIGWSLRGPDRGEPAFADAETAGAALDGSWLERWWESRRVLRGVVVGLTALTLVSLLLALRALPAGRAHPVVPAKASASSPRAEGTARRTVRVQIRANPAESRLFFDHARLPQNPALSTMQADGQQHVVRAEADGHGTAELRFVLESDVDLNLTLDPSRPPRPRSPAPAGPRPQQSAHSGDDRCNPPFVVDARGVKVFLPECL